MPLLDTLVKHQPDPKLDGWKSLRDLIEESESRPTKTTALRAVKRALAAGSLERKTFRLMMDGKVRWVPCYREKK